MRYFILVFLMGFFSPSGRGLAQVKSVTLSGQIRDKATKEVLPFVNLVLKTEKDSSFVSGTISSEKGRFVVSNLKPGHYVLQASFLGYGTKKQPLFVGELSDFLDVGMIELEESQTTLAEVTVVGKQDEVAEKMDKKTFSLADNISQSGASVLQAMQNLPGVSVQDGKVQLRGNDKVVVLIDGKQTALTGFGNQTGLDNLPASAIEKIEIINNPSAKYDANGNGGIINIVYKKNKEEGWTGKAGLAGGLGALWVRKDNLPGIRSQYQATPKINPTVSLNYRKNKLNAFFQGDYLYTETLNKNEFVTRTYDDGTIIQQQTKRNRNTHFLTSKIGLDWSINEQNNLTISGLFGTEKITDRGDQPFFNGDYSSRSRLWQFLEDELKTTIAGTMAFQHKFSQPGRLLNMNLNYSFHRENEIYFFDNILPTFSGKDAFKLLSDENVTDFGLDYIRPLKYGRFESGLKFRWRYIPTNMRFIPGQNSPLDSNAGGWATYDEIIPAAYGNYVFENEKVEAEVGLRVEYVNLQYRVNPNHNTYKSNGYDYTQPFPNIRLAWKLTDDQKISLFYNRRVDRPNEVDIRIFPKYDDAEIIKVGNPALRPQFTNSVELGYKTSLPKGFFFAAAYHKMADATITRIASTVPGSTLIYNVFQNVNKSFNTGLELVFNQEITPWYGFNLNALGYHNQIDGFTVTNLYPTPRTIIQERQEIWSGNVKANNQFHLPGNLDVQLTAIFLAPDIIPQGKTNARFTIDAGLKKKIQSGMGELFLNATDLLNTLIIKKEIQAEGFKYTSIDYYETQVVRIGYNRKF